MTDGGGRLNHLRRIRNRIGGRRPWVDPNGMVELGRSTDGKVEGYKNPAGKDSNRGTGLALAFTDRVVPDPDNPVFGIERRMPGSLVIAYTGKGGKEVTLGSAETNEQGRIDPRALIVDALKDAGVPIRNAFFNKADGGVFDPNKVSAHLELMDGRRVELKIEGNRTEDFEIVPMRIILAPLEKAEETPTAGLN